MNRHDILMVATYQMKLLSREWVFGFLAGLTLLIVFSVQVFLQGRDLEYSWDMVALSSSVPLLHAYFFNIVQTFVVIFIIPGIFGKEGDGGIADSWYVRPFGNREYLFGKFLGCLFMMIILNGLSMVVSLFFNVVGTIAPCNPLYFLFYFVTLTFPSLIFMLGLGFWLAGLLRVYFFSRMILCCFLVFSLQVLSGKSYGVFDFSGIGLPNMFSEMTGHVEWYFYLSQRFLVLILGIGFVFLSISNVRRIPNDVYRMRQCTFIGYMCVLAGVVIGVGWGYRFVEERVFRNSCRDSFERHWDPETCGVSDHSIVLEQKGNALSLESEMTVRNPHEKSLERLVFFLNPGLQVVKLEEGGRPLSFERDHQVVLVDRPVVPGDSVRLRWTYEGCLDPDFNDLDIPDKRYGVWPQRKYIFNYGRASFFCDRDVLLLTPLSLWYPVSLPLLNLAQPNFSIRDFTRFDLKIVRPQQKVVLSQGNRRVRGDTLCFSSSSLLDGVSVCGGEYTRKRIDVDSLIIDLYYVPGHDFVSRHFNCLKQGDVKKLIKENLPYPFSESKKYASSFGTNDSSRVDPTACRYMFIEAPVAFNSYYRLAIDRSDKVQYGMCFLPEKGVGLDVNLFDRDKREYIVREAEMNGMRSTRDEKAIETMMFNKICSNVDSKYTIVSQYTPFEEKWFSLGDFSDGFIENNLYSLHTVFNDPPFQLFSSRYPGIDLFFKTFTRERIRFRRVLFSDVNAISRCEFSAREYLQTKGLLDALRDKMLDDRIMREILLLKGKLFLDMISDQVPSGLFFEYMDHCANKYQGEITLEKFASDMENALGIDLLKILPELYAFSRPPIFRVRDMEVVQVRVEGRCFGIGQVAVMNAGEEGGWVFVSGNGASRSDFCRKLYLQPGEAKQIRVVWEDMGEMNLNTGISRNFPPTFTASRKLEYNDFHSVDTTQGVFDVDMAVFSPAANEIVVDNEDSGFRLIEPLFKGLREWFWQKDIKGEVYDEALLPMPRWMRYWVDMGYGDTIRTVFCKAGGNGRSMAEWKTSIRDTGLYDIQVAVCHVQFMNVLKSKDLKYEYTLFLDGREHHVTLMLDEVEGQWVSLGQYRLPVGESRVVLSDRGSPMLFVFADAVKWVKVK